MNTRFPFYEAVRAGRPTCLFTDDVPRVRSDLRAWVEGEPALRLVCLELEPGGDIRTLVDSLLAQSAHTLRLLWPDWYGSEPSRENSTDSSGLVRHWCSLHPQVNPRWLQWAVSHCRSGKAPVSSRWSPAVQMRQLRLAMGMQDVLLAVFAGRDGQGRTYLQPLARAVEWLARETEAAVMVILPREWMAAAELDSINSQALVWPPCTPPPEPAEGDVEPARSTLAPSSGPLDEQKHRFVPLVGKPHPASPGEQLLAEWLARDDELRNLFLFNQRVETRFQSTYLVDLVWSAGNVVVEVDGYGWHSTRAAFHDDRRRDYELTLSGYLVLRLPHEFVIEDPQLACERIREFVAFRTRYPFTRENSS